MPTLETDITPDSASPKEGLEKPRAPLVGGEEAAVIAPATRRRKPRFFRNTVSARELAVDGVADQTLIAADLDTSSTVDFFAPALTWYSPRSVTGSLLWAIAIHASIYLSLLLYLTVSLHFRAEDTSSNVEFQYDTFSAPPDPTQKVQRVARHEAQDVPKEKSPIVKGPKELQDNTSNVAGTQTEAQAKPSVSSEGTGDAATTPYYKIWPKYPRAALVAGTSGYILLKVDVKENGEIENVRVVGGEERSLFQEEARRAVSKWKYKPFLDASGNPVRKIDWPIRVDFNIKDADKFSK